MFVTLEVILCCERTALKLIKVVIYSLKQIFSFFFAASLSASTRRAGNAEASDLGNVDSNAIYDEAFEGFSSLREVLAEDVIRQLNAQVRQLLMFIVQIEAEHNFFLSTSLTKLEVFCEYEQNYRLILDLFFYVCFCTCSWVFRLSWIRGAGQLTCCKSQTRVRP